MKKTLALVGLAVALVGGAASVAGTANASARATREPLHIRIHLLTWLGDPNSGGRLHSAPVELISGGRPIYKKVVHPNGGVPITVKQIVGVSGGRVFKRFRTNAHGLAIINWPEKGSYFLCASLFAHGVREVECEPKMAVLLQPAGRPEATITDYWAFIFN